MTSPRTRTAASSRWRASGTTTLRASHNGIFSNQLGGLVQSSGSLFTACTGSLPCTAPATFTNYVRDNNPGDNFGAQPDSLM